MKQREKICLSAALILFITMALTACGGGGGGGEGEPTYTISPAVGSTIGYNDAITLVFSESMDTSTLVIGGDFADEDDGGEWTAHVNANDTLTISPLSAWTTGESRTLAVVASDIDGNPIPG